jgi:vancomycin resistance protein YoaR
MPPMAGPWRKRGAWALGGLVAVAALPLLVFLTDQAFHRGEAARNTVLAGRPVGGLGRGALEGALDDLAPEVASRTIVLQGEGRAITASYQQLGIGIDRSTVFDAVMASGRVGGLIEDAVSWWSSFDRKRRVELVYSIDEATAASWLQSHPEARPADPVEPTYSGRTGAIVVERGQDGLALDVAGAVAELREAVRAGAPPPSLAVVWEVVPPAIDDEELQAAVDAANQLVADDLRVMVNGRVATIGKGTVARWIEAGDIDDGLMPRFAASRAQASVERLLAGLTDPGTPPVFQVEDGEVTVELGAEPMRCCADGVAEALFARASQGDLGVVRLDAVPVYDDAGAAAAEALGIRQKIATFTTEHACCQSRVENIHRIADLVRGVVIEPGDRFSINEFVGQRTRENGFVAAGVISQGHFTDDVGGGISQFATTMFNAAFFAGLDIEDYQSHSIYISRYPYGREATLSYPAPDLALANNTPYGMLIWTSYDDRSITVELYSTPYYRVEQTGQRRLGWGACTRVETYRSRTDPTGDVIEDTFYATYRPGEGLDCAGRRTPTPD